MIQSFSFNSRTILVTTLKSYLTGNLLNLAIANWTLYGHSKFLFLTSTQLFYHLPDIRYHISRSSNNYRISQFNPEPFNLVYVVESCPGNSHTSYIHRPSY